MGKGKKTAAGDDILVKGSGKAYKKKGEKNGKAGKVVTVIVSILVVLIVVGVIASYSIYNGGTIQRHTAAAESEHYTVTTSMMTYYFNSTYQNYVNSYSSYLSYMGLDTSKALEDQTYSDGQTWYDQFMTSTKSDVQELLVLAEGAYKEGIELTDDERDEIQTQLDSFGTYATNYNVTESYYIKKIYGECVTLKDIKKCLELSTLASDYYTYMTDKYDFTEEDWAAYYDENRVSFDKVDYLSYTFKNAESTDATSEENTDAKVDAATLRGYAEGLAAVKTADEFNAYIENYLRTVTYAGLDDAALEADKVDIQSEVDACLTEGSTYSETSDFSKWAFDEGRSAYEVYTTYDDEAATYTVYMLMPASDTADLGLNCIYRDNYNLVDYRYIFVSLEDYDDDATAKEVADSILAEYNEDATEDNFAELASAEKYGDGNYDGGLIENADYSALADEVDAWAFDSARKAGDTEIIQVEESGYYIVYFSGTGSLKWQNNANNALISEKYEEDYKTLADEYTVTMKSKGLNMVKEVSLASSSSTTAASTVPTSTTTAATTTAADTTVAATTAAE